LKGQFEEEIAICYHSEKALDIYTNIRINQTNQNLISPLIQFCEQLALECHSVVMLLGSWQ
jgi:hypothetical protein